MKWHAAGTVLLFLLLIVSPPAAVADLIVLKSGEHIETSRVEEHDGQVWYPVGTAMIGIPRDEVARVLRGPAVFEFLAEEEAQASARMVPPEACRGTRWASGGKAYLDLAPRVGEPETLLRAWIDCHDQRHLKDVIETPAAGGIRRQYVLYFGWNYYTQNGVITAIQRSGQ
jgi:hypothetical protein